MHYWIARYYFDSLFRTAANETFIDDLFNSSPILKEGDLSYVIGNVELDEHKGFQFIRGTLGRLRSNELIDVFDEQNRQFKKQEIAEVADRLVEFLIEPSTHLIFIQEDHILKPAVVAHKIKQIYSNVSQIATLEIDFVFQEKDVYDTIKTWERVNKIHFRDLRPTNPSSKDSFRELEDLLKETGSTKTDITFEIEAKGSNKDQKEQTSGLNYDSLLIRQPLALSAHGYGSAKLEGSENGRAVQVESKKFVRRVEVNFREDGALDRIVQEITEIQADTDGE